MNKNYPAGEIRYRIPKPFPKEKARGMSTDLLRLRVLPDIAEVLEIFLILNGAQAGPYSQFQVAHMAAVGTIEYNTPYWMEGMQEWVPVSDLIDSDPAIKSVHDAFC